MASAFIFDLDGVLIDDEQTWEDEKQKLYKHLFGPVIAENIGSTLGINMDGIYEKARALEPSIDKQSLIDAFYRLAPHIYKTAPIPAGTDDLIEGLKKLDYRLAVVSASPLSWVTTAISRLKSQDRFELILSLHERPDLKHKPNPDGYIEAVELLGSDAQNSIALEDSNPGIKSAKTAGLFTIGYRGNLVKGYRQEGADAYASSMREVWELAKNKFAES